MAVEINRHWFGIEEVVLTAGKNYSIDPARVGLFQILNDYLNRRLPIIKIKISLTSDMIKILYDNIDNAKLAIEITENRVGDDDSILNSKTLLKDTFDIIPSTSVDTYDTITTDDPNNELNPKFDIVTLYLVKTDRIRAMDKEIATVFSDTDKAAALQSLFSIRDIPAKTCVITPPVNNDAIDMMILPLGDLVRNVDWLNQQYGLWSSSAVIFDDYQYVYCLDYYKPNIVMAKATDYDTVVFTLTNRADQLRVMRGSGNDAENRRHLVNISTEPAIEDNVRVATTMEFGTIATVDTDGNVKKYTFDENSPKMKFVRANNDLTVDQYVNNTLNTSMLVTLEANNTGVSFFKPYKIYRFELGDTTSSGSSLANKEFRLQYLSISLIRKQQRLESDVIMKLSVVN